MFWLEFSVLVATVTDGDGTTSREKYPVLPQKQLEVSAVVLKKTPTVDTTKTDGNIPSCPLKYPLV